MLDLSKSYDIIKVIDIPASNLSEKLVTYLASNERYRDANAAEHIYNADQIIMEGPYCEPILKKELEMICKLCHDNEAIYFRTVED